MCYLWSDSINFSCHSSLHPPSCSEREVDVVKVFTVLFLLHFEVIKLYFTPVSVTERWDHKHQFMYEIHLNLIYVFPTRLYVCIMCICECGHINSCLFSVQSFVVYFFPPNFIYWVSQHIIDNKSCRVLILIWHTNRTHKRKKEKSQKGTNTDTC